MGNPGFQVFAIFHFYQATNKQILITQSGPAVGAKIESAIIRVDKWRLLM
jgi:hypothetical protein